MANPARPEPMNATPHHSKVNVSILLVDPLFIAGTHVAGKMEMECRADSGLGIETMMVELFAVQEMTSCDLSGTKTFLHSRRIFQGPGLPPSNAVEPEYVPLFPPHYHQARRGRSTFLFRIPIPATAPSSINFGNGLVNVRYELRASVAAYWKGVRRVVTATREIDVVESYEANCRTYEHEAVAFGENGKFWVQGRVIGGVIVEGEGASIELQVKNYSSTTNTGLTLTLYRTLVLPGNSAINQQALKVSDTLTTVPFVGQEYIIPSGAEGLVNLIFDIPEYARGSRGGSIIGADVDGQVQELLFEVRCVIGINLTMGPRSKDISLDIPIMVVHPAALPFEHYESQRIAKFTSPAPYQYPVPYEPASSLSPFYDRGMNPNAFSDVPMQNSTSYPALEGKPAVYPNYNYSHVPNQIQPNLLTPRSTPPISLARPSSAGLGPVSNPYPMFSGLQLLPQYRIPLETRLQQFAEPEEGKGECAFRIAQNLRISSRNRSVSPLSHRYPMPHVSPVAVCQMRSLPIPPVVGTHNFLVSPIVSTRENENVVYSPRPHSMIDNLPKSDCVDELERMAEDVGNQNLDLSADIPHSSPKLDACNEKVNETLSGFRGRLELEPYEKVIFNHERTRNETFSAANSVPSIPTYLDETPPTPNLTPILIPNFTSRNVPSREESGLDALERRLLSQVGVRSEDQVADESDMSILLPIAIPKKPVDPLIDSAISSLSLADHEFPREPDPEPDHESEGKTHRQGKSTKSLSGDDLEGSLGRTRVPDLPPQGLRIPRKSIPEVENKRLERKKYRGQDGRVKTKNSKGKVTAWLGSVDPAVPPEESSGIPEGLSMADISVSLSAKEIESTTHLVHVPEAIPMSPSVQEPQQRDDAPSIPSHCSSGFVPIATIKLDGQQDHFAVNEHEERGKDLKSIRLETISRSNDFDTHAISPARPRGLIQPVRALSNIMSAASDFPKPFLNSTISIDNYKDMGNEIVTNTNTGRSATRTLVRARPSLPISPFPPPSAPSDEVPGRRGGEGASLWDFVSETKDAGATLETPRQADAPVLQKQKYLISGKFTREHLAEGQKSVADIKVLRGAVLANDSEGETANKKLLGALTPSPTCSSSPPVTVTVVETKYMELAGKRSRPIVKSSFVPAVISSTHAVPMLSSTESLIGPQALSYSERRKALLPSPLVRIATRPDLETRNGGPVELSSGKSRLRDLIKKYQGQGS